MNVNDHDFAELFKKYKKICVIGLSPDSSKPSRGVPLYMKARGFDVVGVYPKAVRDDDFKIYTELSQVPAEYRRFINVFRRSENIPEVVDEILKVGGCEVLWLQLGIAHAEAEKKAEQAGLKVISDRCLKVEYARI